MSDTVRGDYDHNRCRVCGVPWDGTPAASLPGPHTGGHSVLSPDCACRPPIETSSNQNHDGVLKQATVA
jgi:hypothetical protein